VKREQQLRLELEAAVTVLSRVEIRERLIALMSEAIVALVRDAQRGDGDERPELQSQD
jgi:hypothetical protein